MNVLRFSLPAIWFWRGEYVPVLNLNQGIARLIHLSLMCLHQQRRTQWRKVLPNKITSSDLLDKKLQKLLQWIFAQDIACDLRESAFPDGWNWSNLPTERLFWREIAVWCYIGIVTMAWHHLWQNCPSVILKYFKFCEEKHLQLLIALDGSWDIYGIMPYIEAGFEFVCSRPVNILNWWTS